MLSPNRAFGTITLAVCAACASKDALTSPRGQTAMLRIVSQVAAQTTTTQSIEVRVRYAQTSGALIDLAKTTATVTGASQDVSVRVDLGPCLSDEAHIGSTTTCELHVVVRLLDSNNAVVDSAQVAPLTASPGSSLTPSAVSVTGGTGGGSGTITVDYSTCPADAPTWVAFQDGTGPWTVITPTNGAYRFTVQSTKLGFARQSAGIGVEVIYATRSEFTAFGAAAFCSGFAGGGGVSMTGTANGIGTNQFGSVYLAGGSASGLLSGAFTISGARPGVADLVGYRVNINTTTFVYTPSLSDRLVIKRDINVTQGSSVGTVDFAGASAIVPQQNTLTLSNAGTDSVFAGLGYLTGSLCDIALFYDIPLAGTTMPLMGVPASVQRSTDFHYLTASATSGAMTREITLSYHTAANQTIALPTAFTAPPVTTLSGSYKRLSATFGTLPSEYNFVELEYYNINAIGDIAVVEASTAWLGSGGTISMPDFTGLSGWNGGLLPTSSSTVFVAVGAIGFDFAGGSSLCDEGRRESIILFSSQH